MAIDRGSPPDTSVSKQHMPGSGDEKAGNAEPRASRALETYRTTVELLGAVAWPAIAIIILIFFHNPLENILRRASHIKFFNVEANIAPAQIANSLRAALNAMVQSKLAITPDSVKELLKAFDNEENAIKSLREGRILWVDDNPQENTNLINAFQALGVRVALALTTDAAKSLLANSQYDVIITDMSRPGDKEAGTSLIRYLRLNNVKSPVIVYADKWARDNQGKEALIDAYKITANTNEVYFLTIKLLQGAM